MKDLRHFSGVEMSQSITYFLELNGWDEKDSKSGIITTTCYTQSYEET